MTGSKGATRVVRSAGLATAALIACAVPALACASPPPPVRDLDLPPFYGAASNARLDPKQQAINAAAGEPLTAYLNAVTAAADLSLTGPTPAERRAAARCALDWLSAWARGGAWLGRMATDQSEYQRKWDLAGLSLAYLKVKRAARPSERALVESWLGRIATTARAVFDDPRHQRNNHWYWLGLGLAGTALATGEDRWWAEARRIMQDAAREIRADGALPRELARGARAVHYHAFSVMPLVILAGLGASRGEDWYGIEGGALHRLVALTISGLRDPTIFERLAGVAQEPSAGSSGTGWLPLYTRRFPDRAKVAAVAMPTSHRWTGGDVLMLARVLAPRR